MESYQIQSVLETLIMATGVLGALWIISRTWLLRRSSSGDPHATRLVESVDKLRESVEGMRDELSDLAERLEFTERILARVADGATSSRKELPRM